MFRSTLGMYIEGLPKEFKIPLVAHNRNQMVLKNRSRIFYQIAGNKARLGQGKAITYLHGTETASWGNEEGLASLIASLAEKNPERLYLFESTAQGFNMFHDMYKTAKKARTQRAIFCGWWRNEYCYVRKWRTENPEKVKEHQRKNSHQRRVRLQGGRFERFDYVEIFERDNWICGICTKPIDNKLKWPNPMSVSLDHIVPVSRGGGHVKENVQSAHLSCNISKGSNG